MKKLFALAMIVVIAMPLVGECTVTYDDKVDFLQSVALALNMESFEMLPVDDGVSRHSALMLPHFRMTEQGTNLSVHNIANLGVFATDGVNYVRDTDGLVMKFTFNDPQRIFGINITDWGDNGTGTLTFSNNAGQAFQIATGAQPSGNLLFFGIVGDTSFTEVTLSQTLSNDSWAVDEVYYNVPEPSTLLLIGLGAVMLRKK